VGSVRLKDIKSYKVKEAQNGVDAISLGKARVHVHDNSTRYITFTTPKPQSLPKKSKCKYQSHWDGQQSLTR